MPQRDHYADTFGKLPTERIPLCTRCQAKNPLRSLSDPERCMCCLYLEPCTCGSGELGAGQPCNVCWVPGPEPVITPEEMREHLEKEWERYDRRR